MIANQMALLKREFWEHRSIWVAPAAIAFVSVLLTATGLVIGSNFKEVVNLAIVGASNVGEGERRAMITAALSGFIAIFVIAMWILTIFYCLDALYAERKDKSILFWRSLPITDTETVVSKLLIAVIVIPAVTFVAIVASQLLSLIIMSIWISVQGGSPGHLLWDFGALFDVWTFTLFFILSIPLWLAPLIGWFLFVSAFTKRSPLLVAFLPIFVVPALERMVFGTSLLFDAIFVRSFKTPLFGNLNLPGELIDEDHFQMSAEMMSIMSLVDFSGFLLSPSLWIGFLVCGLFATAAVFVRRYRDDS
ncbi:MAG: hypothetical protein AAGE85_17580 [Pseudomonadota bacterium]